MTLFTNFKNWREILFLGYFGRKSNLNSFASDAMFVPGSQDRGYWMTLHG